MSASSQDFTQERFGAIAIFLGLITQSQLDAAVDWMRSTRSNRKKIGRVLMRNGSMQEIDVIRVLAKQKKLKIVDLDNLTLPESTLDMIIYGVTQVYRAIPIGKSRDKIIVAICEESYEPNIVKNLELISEKKIEIRLTTSLQMSNALQKYYGGSIGLTDASALSSRGNGLIPDGVVIPFEHQHLDSSENAARLDAIEKQLAEMGAKLSKIEKALFPRKEPWEGRGPLIRGAKKRGSSESADPPGTVNVVPPGYKD